MPIFKRNGYNVELLPSVDHGAVDGAEPVDERRIEIGRVRIHRDESPTGPVHVVEPSPAEVALLSNAEALAVRLESVRHPGPYSGLLGDLGAAWTDPHDFLPLMPMAGEFNPIAPPLRTEEDRQALVAAGRRRAVDPDGDSAAWLAGRGAEILWGPWWDGLAAEARTAGSVVKRPLQASGTTTSTVSVGQHTYTARVMDGTTVVSSSGSFVVNVASSVAPVVLDLNRDGELSYANTVMDVNSDGVMDSTLWAGVQDGVLVWDKYHDGRVRLLLDRLRARSSSRRAAR